MRYVIFSDVHGNWLSYKKMIDQVKDIDISGYIFCGDLVGYYYDSLKIIESMKKINNLYSVMGNHDFLYKKIYEGEDNTFAVSRYGSSYNNLDRDVYEFISDMPTSQEIKINNSKITICHGSMDNLLDGRLYPDTVIKNENLTTDFLIIGHTHYRMYRKIGNCNVINPGSLGQPRDGKGFSYAIIDFNTGEIIFHNIGDVNIKSLLRQVVEKDPTLPYLYDVLLRNGKME